MRFFMSKAKMKTRLDNLILETASKNIIKCFQSTDPKSLMLSEMNKNLHDSPYDFTEGEKEYAREEVLKFLKASMVI